MDGNDGPASTGGSVGDDGGDDGIGVDSGIGTDDGGSQPPPPGGTIEDPPLTPCETPTDCCDAIEGCDDPSLFICTADKYCGLIKGTCSDHADCQGDTYCCSGDCRGDSVGEGVCIPANVPPGVDCSSNLEIGEFAPSVQCEWSGPASGEVDPSSKHVLTTPLVAQLPYDNGVSAELVVLTAGGSSTPSSSAPGVLRIINGQDCKLVDSIKTSPEVISALATPAIGDLDGDGVPEIVVRGENKKVIALKWNGTTYVKSWAGDINTAREQAWAGPSIHDLNDDGSPEVLVGANVWSATGTRIFAGTDMYEPWNGLIPIVGDFDRDGKIEFISQRSGAVTVSEWNGSSWVDPGWNGRLGVAGSHFAVADFGSVVGGVFDRDAFDGIAEIVSVEDQDQGTISIRTLSGFNVMTATLGDRGGPPVIGDFDNDGRPEVGVAGETRLRVFDLDCPTGCNGEANWVRWSQPSQDASSAQTGATIFDFDGDGNAEVVYADECFLRVYSGTDGKVVFSSYRTSATWYESPLVADIDGDQNTEIVVNNNAYGETRCPTSGGSGGPYVDPIHEGIQCSDDAACPGGTTCTGGLCRCSATTDCCGSANLAACGLTCAPAIDGSGSSGNVCRATHPGSSASLTGIRVLRDRLDRWASSRSIWNQHAYSVTNITDAGGIPRTSDWTPNWVEVDLNNYRQNVQGAAGFDDLPDITGRFTDDEPCVTGTSSIYVQATVCNRGKRAVGAALPATFYEGKDASGKILCTSYTDGPVPTGGCSLVYCAVGNDVAGKTISIRVNDDGHGGQTTVECRPDNNTDWVQVGSCSVPVPR